VLVDDGKFDGEKHSPSSAELIEREGLGESRSFSPVISEEVEYRDLPPGPHKLRATLVTNDHGGPVELAEADVEFTVGG
jgi:hypothetical protein